MNDTEPLFRSPLFVPGHKSEMIQRAVELPADAILLDLEDAVPAHKKSDARSNIENCLERSVFDDVTVFCRVNDITTDHISADIRAAVHDDLDGFVYPEVKSRENLSTFVRMVSEAESEFRTSRHHTIPLIESPSGVLNARSICEATDRNVAVAFGSEDFLAYLQGDSEQTVLQVPRALVAMSARATGLIPIDTVYIDVHDTEGFRTSAQLADQLGFEGKLLLHPGQIPIANEVFSPDEEKVEQARRVIAASEGELEDDTVSTVDGEFIGPPIIKAARKTLNRARKIEDRE
ncbi:HpcH/HpaI aldolase/citrate lyase family protein [Halosimplex marinum]|uniref:HpcH/HpaI aldolase/citrate lyase family protein n=1 Tax=Halosimplex marinum TaxID=3396620 RepID=UPI003F5561D9